MVYMHYGRGRCVSTDEERVAPPTPVVRRRGGGEDRKKALDTLHVSRHHVLSPGEPPCDGSDPWCACIALRSFPCLQGGLACAESTSPGPSLVRRGAVGAVYVAVSSAPPCLKTWAIRPRNEVGHPAVRGSSPSPPRNEVGHPGRINGGICEPFRLESNLLGE